MEEVLVNVDVVTLTEALYAEQIYLSAEDV